MFVDEPFVNSVALMQTSNGDVITQFDLHTIEKCGLIKIDLLSIEALDKIRACLELLIKDNLIKSKGKTLKEIYEDTIGIYKIERDENKMWDLLHQHKILSLFQMEKMSGIKGIEAVHPNTVDELATLNSVIRLMSTEKGAKQPLDKFAEQKQDNSIWEREMIQYGLSKDEREWLHSCLDISFGICESQEKLMSMLQDERIGGHSLLFADTVRKAIAKKQPKQFIECEKQFFKTMEEKQLSKPLCEYCWNQIFSIQRGYSFCAAHTVGYSLIGLQEMNLAYKFPIIYWNTANLIVDSGAMVLSQEVDKDEKIENSSVDYGKISTSIGVMRKAGIKVSLPDINKSDFTFRPDTEKNVILYGLKGIARIGNQLVKDIISGRPYSSITDFEDKIKVNKTQMINLIKAGAFDLLEKKPREQILNDYLVEITDTKNKLTLQNFATLIKYDILPLELDFEKRLFNFNKYLKKNKQGDYYEIDNIAAKFYEQYFDFELLIEQDSKLYIAQKQWDKIYKAKMDTARLYLKDNQDVLLNKLNRALVEENFGKYIEGNISKWEMDSLGFYYHEHELQEVDRQLYGIENYFNIKPTIDRTFRDKEGREIAVYSLHRICGTVIDKDKNKNTLKLLTPDGVVDIKIWKSQYTKFDKQISQVGDDGKKHVLEKSFFTRGTKLLLTGIKRDGMFIPKVYKNSTWQYPIQKIEDVKSSGELVLINDRIDLEEE